MSSDPSSASAVPLATDCSSLVDLKAEVFRKQQEARFNKNKAASSSGKDDKAGGSSRDGNKDAIWSKQNAGLTQREKKDLKEKLEEDAKVRSALEVKSRLYDQLNRGRTTDGDQRFLVNFDAKNGRGGSSSEDEDEGVESYTYEERKPKNPGEEWVEYTDALGRSRMAMRKDLDDLKSQDQNLKQIWKERDARREEEDRYAEGNYYQREESPPPQHSVGPQTSATLDNDNPEMMSEDMRRDLLRQKWEQEEEENLKKTKLHYRDVLYDEARTHGAAFYNFSRDETKRTEELDNLDALHKETEATRSANDRAKAKRKAALALRLKKVRDRKRLKMGLPVSQDEEGPQGQPGDGDDSEEESEAAEKKMDMMVMSGLKEMRDLQEKLRKEEEDRKKAKRQGPREWDRGKEGIEEVLGRSSDGPRVLSQKEWVDKQRKERANEFAPPSAYEKDKSSAGPSPGTSAVGGHSRNQTQQKMGSRHPQHQGGPPRNKMQRQHQPPPQKSHDSTPGGYPTNQQQQQQKLSRTPAGFGGHQQAEFSQPPPNFGRPPPPGFDGPPPPRPEEADASGGPHQASPMYPPNPYENEFGAPEGFSNIQSSRPNKFTPHQAPKSSNKMSTKSRLQLHKEMMESYGGGGEESKAESKRGMGAEFEPPPLMDYYAGGGPSKAPRLPKPPKSSMSDSISVGISSQLKHFRNQSSHGAGSKDSDSE